MIRNLLWWTGYVVTAIWLQKLLPGLDALLPGLIICLQGGSRQQSVLFGLFCLALQEGTSTLPFGTSIVWYGVIVALYFVGSRFFVETNLPFVIIISLFSGVWRGALFFSISSLQALPLDSRDLYEVCVLQIVATPLIWLAAVITRFRIVKHENPD